MVVVQRGSDGAALFVVETPSEAFDFVDLLSAGDELLKLSTHQRAGGARAAAPSGPSFNFGAAPPPP